MGPADRLRGRVARDPREGGVDVGDVAGAIGGDHRLRRLVHGRGQASSLGGRERGVLAGGDGQSRDHKGHEQTGSGKVLAEHVGVVPVPNARRHERRGDGDVGEPGEGAGIVGQASLQHVPVPDSPLGVRRQGQQRPRARVENAGEPARRVDPLEALDAGDDVPAEDEEQSHGRDAQGRSGAGTQTAEHDRPDGEDQG